MEIAGFPRQVGEKTKKLYPCITKNKSLNPTSYLFTFQFLLTPTNTLHKYFPYLDTLPNIIRIWTTYQKSIAILNYCQSVPYLNRFLNFSQSQFNGENHSILMQCRFIPYLETFSKFTTYYFLAELYLNLIHCRTVPYLNRLPNHGPFYYVGELYPILLHCRSSSYLITLENYTLSQYTGVGLHEKLSEANQKWLFCNPDQQPMGIECYVTWGLSATVEISCRLSGHFVRYTFS